MSGKKEDVVVVWLQRDLRLHDNPALQAALAHATCVVRIPPRIWNFVVIVGGAPLFPPAGFALAQVTILDFTGADLYLGPRRGRSIPTWPSVEMVASE
jgi:DNA photolyase